jgi:deoxyribodipyrimidine photo-lyase
VRNINGKSVCPEGEYVLYWMTAQRRTSWNFALEHAVAWAKKLRKPLLVFEPLRAGYRWASVRVHQFVLDGMMDNARRFADRGVAYFPYVEPQADAGKGLLAALAERACVVVTDESPAFFHPRMLTAAGAQVATQVDAVDSNGLLPLTASTTVFKTAFQFRRFVHAQLPDHHPVSPVANPLRGTRLPRLPKLPASVTRRWKPTDIARLLRSAAPLDQFPIDQSVSAASVSGGSAAASERLTAFVSHRLAEYAELRNHPDSDAASGLSPYLHFGHISAHEAVHAVLQAESWSPDRVNPGARGRRSGWWGISESAESFLDELITWRELGYNMCALEPKYAEYGSLPEWARATLEAHADDVRPYVYSLEEFEEARTHDALWNAAQRQLLTEGRMHNYLRMLWGKKILEWSPSPELALEIMIELNNRYALDGRDPNSYSGIFWVLGRYDRPWGPERPVLGKVRYMTSENTARKLRVKEYIERYTSHRPPSRATNRPPRAS